MKVQLITIISILVLLMVVIPICVNTPGDSSVQNNISENLAEYKKLVEEYNEFR